MPLPLRLRSAAAVSALALTALAPPAHAAPVLVLDIDFNSGSQGSVITSPVLLGTASGSLTAGVVTEGGGQAVTGPNPASSSNKAMRLPAYAVLNRPNTPLAVLKVGNATATEAISIGDQTFTWQADFSQDTNLGTDANDGDNIFQRGLAGATSQWKLSADGHKVGCYMRVNGVGFNTGTITITDTAWYRAICKRTRVNATTGTLVLTLRRWDGAAFVTVGTKQSATNAAGDMPFPVGTPMTVGGKLNNNGTLHSQPDQFNGSIDNVQLRVG